MHAKLVAPDVPPVEVMENVLNVLQAIIMTVPKEHAQLVLILPVLPVVLI